MLDVSGKFDGTTAVIFDLIALRHTECERERVIVELQQALTEVKTLSKLLHLRLVQKSTGWRGLLEPIEAYFAEHTHTTFTHGMCPEVCYAIRKDEALGRLR